MYRHVIEVEGRFIDNLTNKADGASESISGIGESARKSKKRVDDLGNAKASPDVGLDTSKFTQSMDKVNRILAKFKKVHSAALNLKESGTYQKLKKITDTVEGLTRKTWSVIIRAKDLATAPFRAIRNSLFSLQTLATTIFAGIAANQLVMKPVSLGDSIEQSKIAFETKLGSAAAAESFLQKIYKFDEKSPFDTVQIVGIAQQMMNLGWTAENVLDDLGTIGDWSASLGKGTEGISAVTRALGQMRMKGKLSSEEMLQLTEAGVDAWNYVAKYMGEDITTIREMAEDGEIEVDTAIKAIMAGMGEYTGAAATQADRTVNGLIDQVKSLFQTYVTLPWGEGLGEGLKEGLSMVRDFVDENKDALKSFGETAKEIGQEISAKFADKVQKSLERVREITDSFEFKNADWKGKVSMLWHGLIADPFKEWISDLWSNEENIQKATEFGQSLAEGLTKGILYILGVTDIFKDTGEGAENKGSNIAQGFAKGFVEGFDVSAITDKFVEAINNIWGALPWWAKAILVGYGGSKLAIGAMNLVSGIANTIGHAKYYDELGNAVAGKGILGAIGKFSIANSTYPHLSSTGSGLLGLFGKTGVALGASTTTGAVLTGAGSLAGGATMVAGAGHILKSGYDAYQAHKLGDETTRDAELARAGGTAVGMGVGVVGGIAGAKIGAALGTLIPIPVVGTAAGALIGGGIGTAVGWFAGDKIAKDIEAAKYEAVGLDEEFKSAETDADKLAIRTEALYLHAKHYFGQIALSASEIESIAKSIVWGEDLEFFNQFTAATQTAESALQSLKNASAETNKWMWKAGLNVKFNDDEKESIIASFDDYLANAKSYIENKHYEFTAAANMVLDLTEDGGKGILQDANVYYEKEADKLARLNEELTEKVRDALEDDVISTEPITLPDGTLQLSEYDEIISLQQQIAEITEKLADADFQAELELIKLKLGGGNIDIDSYNKLMSGLETEIQEKVAAYDDAYKSVQKTIAGMYEKGSDEYESAMATAANDYNKKITGLTLEVSDFELNMAGDIWGKAVDKSGDEMADALKNAMETCLLEKTDPITLSDSVLSRMLEIDVSYFEKDPLLADNIRQALSTLFNHLGMITINPDFELDTDGPAVGNVEEFVRKATGEVDAAVPDIVDETVIARITADKEIMNEVELLAEEFNIEPTKMAEVLWKLSAATETEQLEIVAEDFGVNPPYDSIVLLRLTANPSYSKIQLNGNSFLKSTTLTANPTVRIVPRFVEALENNKKTSAIGSNLQKYLPKQNYRGGFVGGTSSAIEGFAEGGFVRGGARLITVAEEGTPEVIIPLGSQRRQRGLDLWMKAGEMLGVNGFEGGRLATGGRDEGIRHHSYSTSGGSVSNDVHVDMGGVHVSISVDARGGENVVEAIKAQSGEIAEAVAGILADELSGQFENTPTKGGAA